MIEQKQNIEFIESTHTYLVDGIIVPSVTQIITKMDPGMYKGVSKAVLKNAAERGDRVHSLIEYWNEHEDTPEWYEKKSFEALSLKRYQSLQITHNIAASGQEIPVCYRHEGMPIFAGKFDMVAMVDGELSIVDIKTTAAYHREYLEKQLTLYKMAIEQTYEMQEPFKQGYCLWLPKRHLGNLIPVSFLDEGKLLEDVLNVTVNHADN